MLHSDNLHKVISIRHLTSSAYVLRFDRRQLDFIAGQHVLLGKAGSLHNREYSIYSSEQDDFFEILVKEVDEGLVSKQLKMLQSSDYVQLEGPLGFFALKPELIPDSRFLFIATGTGIAPFHSITRSYPNLDYTLLHGVRHAWEAYDKGDYQTDRHIVCSTADTNGDFHGRVTNYLRDNPVDPSTHCYLCGNFNMINEVFEILEQQAVPAEQVHAEVYF